MNIFKEAKKYQRQHPKTDWQTCIQKVKGGKRVGSSGNTSTSTKAATTGNRTSTKTVTATVRVGSKKRKPARRKVGAYKVIEKNERRSTPAKKTYRAVRSKAGTFKGMQKVTGADIRAHAKQGLAKALFDYEMAKTIKATKEAAAQKTKFRKLLKSI